MKGIKRSLKENIALLRLRQGDTEAFGYIYDIYVKKIHRYIYFRVSDKGIAHDLTQEVFLQTWEYIVSDKKIRNLKPFIYRIAYNKVVDYYRSKQRQTILIEDVSNSEIDKVSRDKSSGEADLYLLQSKISRLKQDYQDVIILKHIEGLSIKEIADIVEKDENNVRVMIHRAIKSLQDIYNTSDNKS